MNDNDKTVRNESVPPMSSGTQEQGGHLLQTGMMQPPQMPGVLGTIGKYQVIRILGEGGMGQVLLAREPVTDSLVAIKIIKPEFLKKEWAVHRFLTEARHMFKMSHQSLIRVLEVSDRPEGPYFVMPYMAGGSLAQKIKPGEALPSDTIQPLARQVAEALQYAHARGIIHRDLKTSNILLDPEGRAYLCDFGLLRTVFNDSMVDVTRPQVEGTVPYMSPAIAGGKAEDTRCDIYAFGCLLYEMLTGQPPYQGPTVDAILKQIQDGPPQPIRQLNPQAPARLVAIAEHAMGRELRDRYSTMADVINDLDRAAQGKEPIGPHGRVNGTHLRRNVLAALGIVALIGLAVFGISKLPDSSPKPTVQTQFTWTTNNGTMIIIIKYTGPGGAVSIPSTINGHPVTSIGEGAFSGCTNLTNVIIPSSVARIGGWAFRGCSGLTKVTLPFGVTSISEQAFDACTGLTRVTIPNSVTNIGGGAFNYCPKLTSVTIPASVTSMEINPFPCCFELNAIVVDAANPAYSSSADGVLFDKEKTRLISYPAGKPGSYEIPNSVTAIGDVAFIENNSLTSVTIPSNVTTIGQRAFKNCHNLTGIYFKGNAPRLGRGVFDAVNGNATIYYLSGTTGWGKEFAGHPTAAWNPEATKATPAPNPSAGQVMPINLPGGAVMKFCYCPPGSFVMGSPPDEKGRSGNEAQGKEDQVNVRLSKGFWLAQTECTQVQWASVAGNNPSTFIGGDLPVENVSWDDAQRYITKLNEAAILPDGWLAALPTEAQWEYACRAGTKTAYGFGNTINVKLANFANALGKTSAVASYPANAWGLYDMHGNVWEWCEGWFGNQLLGGTDPTGVASGTLRVMRGGGWGTGADSCRAALRGGRVSLGNSGIGFRLALLAAPGHAESKPGLTPHQEASVNPPPGAPAPLVQVPFTWATNNGAITITKYTGPGGEVVIPDKINDLPVTVIGDNAFAGCTILTRVTIPDSVTSIGWVPFVCSGNLISILVGAGNPAYCSVDGVVFNKNRTVLVACPVGKSGTYAIPEHVAEIGDGAFMGCAILTNITIPPSVKQIGRLAFWECGGLTQITIPNGVTNIGISAFSACPKLTRVTLPASVTAMDGNPWRCSGNLASITVDAANPAFSSSEDGVLFNKDKTVLRSCPNAKSGSYEIPERVTAIGECAFRGCDKLTRVTAPAGLKSLGGHSFALCYNLAELYFKGNAPSLSGTLDFAYVNKATIYYQSGTTGWGKEFGGRPTAVWTPQATNAALPAATAQNQFTWTTNNGAITITKYIGPGGAVTIPSKINGLPVTSVGENALSGHTGLTSVTIPNSVTDLGCFAFRDCTNLTHVTIPNSVTNIGCWQFAGCSKLTGVTIHASVTSFDGCAFEGCSQLNALGMDDANPAYSIGEEGVVFNKEKTTIVYYPSGKSGNYVIPARVTQIGGHAFGGSAKLTEVTIPNSVTAIGGSAFIGCSDLIRIEIPNSVSQMGGQMFMGCTSLTNITIPNSVIRIEGWMFENCTRLTTVVVGKSVAKIDFRAFADCGNLTSVYFKGNAPSLENYKGPNLDNEVFAGADKATIYYLPNTTGWGKEFGGRPTAVWTPEAK